jgi:signal transduction histidine kinase
MELKLYQEEEEDKLDKLTFLKNLILSSISILDREDLFSQINEKTINDLGFRKGVILNFNDLGVKVNVNFEPGELEKIRNFFLHKKQMLTTIPLLAYETETGKEITTLFQSKEFLIALIRAKEIHAIFIVNNVLPQTETTVAEKTIFSILCMYLGQCLDNIKLFEELYNEKVQLENKIKERTSELVKTLREIEVISKAKSDFISSVSHELRTPLTSVKGFSSLLVEEKFGVLPPEAKKRLQKIDENVNKLVDMVNMLLDIARIESGKTEVKIAPADVVRLIKDVGDFLSPQMQSKKLDFAVETPESLYVFMDKNLIERVFINLINNALKFTPAGGKITIRCSKEKNHVLVGVQDTGCGMSKDDLQKLFQEFFRANNPATQNAQGTGLVLSLVKKIIETHKEKIWVESEVNKGTTFYFTLKLAEN